MTRQSAVSLSARDSTLLSHCRLVFGAIVQVYTLSEGSTPLILEDVYNAVGDECRVCFGYRDRQCSSHAVTRNRGGLELWLRKGQWQCFDLPSPRSHLVFICTLQQCAQNCFLNVCGIPVVVADGIPRFLARYLHFHLCRLQRKTESVSQC